MIAIKSEKHSNRKSINEICSTCCFVSVAEERGKASAKWLMTKFLLTFLIILISSTKLRSCVCALDDETSSCVVKELKSLINLQQLKDNKRSSGVCVCSFSACTQKTKRAYGNQSIVKRSHATAENLISSECAPVPLINLLIISFYVCMQLLPESVYVKYCTYPSLACYIYMWGVRW